MTSPGASEKVFVDSNILIYHPTQDEFYGELSRSFLKRIEEEELSGYISPVVVSETLFVFIKVWIAENKGVALRKIIRYLKKNPDVLEEIDLSKPIKLISALEMLPVTEEALSRSYAYIPQYHLLPNDAINLSVAWENGLRNFATQDRDFDGVDVVEVWKPRVHGGK